MNESMYFLLKMGNFQCHVSFPGCKWMGPAFTSHEVWPSGRGPTTPTWRTYDHQGYEPLTKRDDPPSRGKNAFANHLFGGGLNIFFLFTSRK